MPYGNDEKQVEVPERNLLGVATARDLPALSQPIETIKEALTCPLKSERLVDFVRQGQKVVIMTSDVMRLGDFRQLILPIVLEQLKLAGIREDDVTILDACGNHEMNTKEQWERMYGRQVLKRCKLVNNNALDASCMVDLGKSELGDRVIVNNLMLDSDLCLGIGSVQPAVPTCGYSGGIKLYAIGGASIQTIFDTHRARIYWHPTARSGVIVGNNFRDHIESVGKKVLSESKAEFFTINAVTNSKTEMIGVFAGDATEVYKEGCSLAQKQWRVPVKQAADIVIAGASPPQASNPYEMNVSMAMVTRYPSDVLKKGGVFIFVGPCDTPPSEGSSSFELLKLMRGFHDADDIVDEVNRHQMDEESEEPTVQNFLLQSRAYGTALMMKNYSSVLVAGAKLPGLVRDMHLVPVRTIEKALEMAIRLMGNDAEILVVPKARGSILHIEQH